MKVDHSRKTGCRIEEGNRRVTERLDRAIKDAEEGNLQQAWVLVRMAIERLYTLVQIKHGPKNFDPSCWASHTAENMWKESVGAIFSHHVPESANRIREITMMTAGGAHDKAPYGATDLINAVNDIRPLLKKLRIGG